MRFWDASAVVPLCVEEEGTALLQGLLDADPAMVVWWSTPVEAASAFARVRRMGGLDQSEEQVARELLAAYAGAWTEMQPSVTLRNRALRLLAVHDLRSADALQLAAAVGWAGEGEDMKEFVCLDRRLADAARREGFRVRP
ncbi:MAG: type II toxin-antitoxin system VapC family toxin [Gemmatimonadota bacterium]